MGKDKVNRMVVVADDFSAVDQIGYDEYSTGLVEMIRSVQAKGAFTIGVFGQWGQGKTSMLRQMEKMLKEIEAPDKKEILTVWFNPWQFTGEEHIIIPFFHTLVSYLDEWTQKKKTAGKKIAKGIVKFLEELANVPVALAYGMEGSIKIPLLLETKFKGKDAIDEARKKEKEIKDKAEPEINKLVDKYESIYYRLISRLQTSAAEMNLKVVVFVDDLDRCLPEKAVELLEGIKVLLDLPGFVFVIAVAREVIEQGIRVRYKELYSTNNKEIAFVEQEYLDKIVQFPLTLPPPDVERLNSMVASYLKDIKETKPYLGTIQKSLGTNPRCLKRCINSLSYTFWVSKKKGAFLPELLIKMTLIAFRFPGFYRVIGRTPAHLLRVQSILEKKEPEKREEKPGTEDMLKDSPGKREPLTTEFTEINDLHLFESPNIESISEILVKREREGVEKDKGFENEEEVRRYVSLLTVTSTPEDMVTIKQRNTDLFEGALRTVNNPTGKDFEMYEEFGIPVPPHI